MIWTYLLGTRHIESYRLRIPVTSIINSNHLRKPSQINQYTSTLKSLTILIAGAVRCNHISLPPRPAPPSSLLPLSATSSSPVVRVLLDTASASNEHPIILSK